MEVVALVVDKINPIFAKSLHTIVVGDPCISTIVTLFSKILKVGRDS
jgi:hypothetical protein